MDTDQLRKVLEEALSVAPSLTEPPYVLNLLLQDADGGAPNANPSLVSLLHTIAKEPNLSIFNGMMQVQPGAATRLEYTFAAAWLIRRAQAVGIEETLKNLLTYIETPTLPCHLTWIISGLKPQSTYDMGRGISLIPWEALENSQQKQMVWEQYMMGFNWPTAALVREFVANKMHVRPADSDKLGDLIKSPDDTELHDAFQCLCLVGPYTSQVLASWVGFPAWAPTLGSGLSLPQPEGHCPAQSLAPDTCQQGIDLFVAFCSRPPQFRALLRLAMQRLNRAMRRTSPVDSAIDLGIALEALYLNDLPEERNELTFRLKVRAARFSGKTGDEQRKIFSLVGDLYAMRSRAVHTGTLDATVKDKPVRDILSDGYSLAAKTMRQFITQGKPSWDAVMFGG